MLKLLKQILIKYYGFCPLSGKRLIFRCFFFKWEKQLLQTPFNPPQLNFVSNWKMFLFLKFVANAKTICIYSDWKDTLWINDLRLCCKFGQAGACCDAPRLAKAGSNQHYWSTGNWQLQYWQQQADLNLYREMKGASIHQTLYPSLSTPQASPLTIFKRLICIGTIPCLLKYGSEVWAQFCEKVLWQTICLSLRPRGNSAMSHPFKWITLSFCNI